MFAHFFKLGKNLLVWNVCDHKWSWWCTYNVRNLYFCKKYFVCDFFWCSRFEIVSWPVCGKTCQIFHGILNFILENFAVSMKQNLSRLLFEGNMLTQRSQIFLRNSSFIYSFTKASATSIIGFSLLVCKEVSQLVELAGWYFFVLFVWVASLYCYYCSHTCHCIRQTK